MTQIPSTHLNPTLATSTTHSPESHDAYNLPHSHPLGWSVHEEGNKFGLELSGQKFYDCRVAGRSPNSSLLYRNPLFAGKKETLKYEL